MSPGKIVLSEKICWSKFRLPGKNPGVNVPGDGPRIFLFPGTTIDNTQQQYWDVNFPEKYLGIIWYFCTYYDKDYISSYMKLCISYGILLYIRLQYVPGVCPNMSRGHGPCALGGKFPFSLTLTIFLGGTKGKDSPVISCGITPV